MGLFFAVFVVVGQSLVVEYVRQRRQAIALIAEGQEVAGRLLKKHTTRDEKSDICASSDTYHVEYSFPFGQNWVSGSLQVPHELYEKLPEPGSEVNVLFHATDPRYSMLVDQDQAAGALFVDGQLLLFGAMFIGGPVCALIVLTMGQARMGEGAGLPTLGGFLVPYLYGSYLQALGVSRQFTSIVGCCGRVTFWEPQLTITSSDPAVATTAAAMPAPVQAPQARVVPAA
jgi:hypothetical protein